MVHASYVAVARHVWGDVNDVTAHVTTRSWAPLVVGYSTDTWLVRSVLFRRDGARFALDRASRWYTSFRGGHISLRTRDGGTHSV
jgi:hypothetical protein